MSTRELLELASLDALGLLDEDERQSFDTAFRAAPPEVQARLRREQARFANADHLLPRVDPPAGLRARVVAAVQTAIAGLRTEEDVLATIGPVPKSRNSAPMWRAACIGFMTATAVLGAMYLMVNQQSQKMQSIVEQGAMSDYIVQDLGVRAKEILMARDARAVSFIPAAADVHSSVTAKLHFDPDSGEAILLCEGLPVADGTYTLTVHNGTVAISLKSIIATGGFVPVHVEDLDENQLMDLTIEGPMTPGGEDTTILTVGDV